MKNPRIALSLVAVALVAAAAPAAVAAAAAPAAAAANDLKVPEQFPTIQAAVNAANVNDTIIISKGDYAESVLVSSKTSLRIIGKPKSRLTGNFPGMAYLKVSGSVNVRIEGLSFGGGEADALVIQSCTNTELSKLTISKLTGRGIVLNNNTNLLLEKSKIDETTSDAIAMTGALSVNATIQQNKISKCGGAGLRLFGLNFVVEKNTFKEVHGVAISFEDSLNTSCTLRKNKISKGDSHGIVLWGQSHIVEDNQISDCAAGTGIAMASTLTNAQHTISKNKLLRVEEGMTVFGGNHTITSNKITKPASCGFAIQCNGNQLEANNVSGAGGDAFQVSGTGNTLHKNKAAGSGGFDLIDSNLTPVNTYTDNKFKKVSAPS